MALQVTGLTRIFHFKKDGKTVELSDFNPNLSPEEVMQFYAGQHEELTTSTIAGPKIEGDKAVYEFKTTVGTKG
ncbi:MAG TPA: PRTRC system protein C [Puia sp.]|jgi:PRTRC genetic system protein C|nr:PRTRC system protein C [Puia sp.]